MSDDVELLKRVYDLFDSRDMESVLAAMHPDVIWTNGMESGHVHGRDEVRSYWKRQWSILNPHVEPVEISSNGKVGYCRSEVYFSGLCLVAAKVQPLLILGPSVQWHFDLDHIQSSPQSQKRYVTHGDM